MITWTRGHSRRAFSFTIIAATIVVCIFVGCSKEGPAGPQGPPGQNGQNGQNGAPDDLSNPNVQPVVVFTLPADGATGPFDVYVPGPTTKPHFIVRFNKFIRLSSVTSSAVTASGFGKPVRVSLYRISGPYPLNPTSGASDLYDHVLAFSISDSLNNYSVIYPIGRQVSIRIDTSITDINGRHLAQPVIFTFNAEPTFRLVSMTPENGSTNVRYGQRVTLYFNSKLSSSIFSALHINPQVDGRWMFYEYSRDSSTVIFMPARPFAFGSTCAVNVNAGARDAFGNVIAGPIAGSFSMVSFRVISAYPSDGSTNNGLNNSIRVELSGPLDTSSVRAAFTISPPITGSLYLYNSSYFYFNPSAQLQPSATYRVTLSSSVRASDGTTFSAPFSFSFTTESFSISLAPSYGTYNYPRSERLMIYSRAELDTNSVRSAVSIFPSVSYRFVMSPPGYSPAVSIYPQTSWASNTTYTLTVGTGLRTKSGVNLSQPESTTFTTGF
ncbi:MAG: Ig-like domain-containing protein [Ignavibacteriae bacterium]|nr:Ig-like domain-containing protein [Ignavibacteriota bacterium]